MLRRLQLTALHRSYSTFDTISSRSAAFIKEISSRGLIYQHSNGLSIDPTLCDPIEGVYMGIDPTAPSLHIGHLLGIMSILHANRLGIPAFIVLGGATGQIGDPSGKSMDRPHLEKSHIQGNLDALHSQVSSVLASTRGTEEHPIRILNNTEWTEKLSCIQFFREVGRHFRVAHMLARDSVKSRLDNGGTSINSNMSINGLGYHEFSYMCFQALDYAHLFETKNVNLQIGGQDQWGNMMSGLDLIQKRNSFKTNTEKSISRGSAPDSRRILAREFGLKAHVLTNPLLTTPSGEKYGKSAGNAVWLDPKLSSPFDFHQYFLKIPDDSIEKHLKYFTFFSLDEIQKIMLKNQDPSSYYYAQKSLAEQLTLLVHGPTGLEKALTGAKLTFSKVPLEAWKVEDFLRCFDHTKRLFHISSREFIDAAIKAIEEGVVRVNQLKRKDPLAMFDWTDCLQEKLMCVLHAGKGNPYIFIIAE